MLTSIHFLARCYPRGRESYCESKQSHYCRFRFNAGKICKIISSSPFPTGESCEVLECQYHAKCFQTTHEDAECRCPQCHPEKAPVRAAPVCGDNDKSYLTMCVLKLESCLLQTWIQKRHDGFCGMQYSILAKTTGTRTCT